MTKTIFLLAILFLLSSINISAQMPTKEVWERLQNESAKDHALIMKMLGITELRTGPSGDPDAPDAANSDKSKATVYNRLPDPLVFNDGTKVTAPEQWVKGKKELFELFDREVYERIPENIPAVKWEIVEEKNINVGRFPVIERMLKGHVDNTSYPSVNVDIEMKLTIPASMNKPVPLVIEGLSRYGKAALVTMAYEPRIAIGFIGSSGAGGAKILRRNFGEQVENLASS